MKSFPLTMMVLTFGLLLCAVAAGGDRRDFLVSIQPVQGTKDAFLLFCSVKVRKEQRNSSSVFTTRLPVIPLRLGKWEESIYVLPGTNPPLQTIRLSGKTTFTFPLAGISRKALLEPAPDYPGEYVLSLYWYEGENDDGLMRMKYRVWTKVSLKPGKEETIAGVEEDL